MKFLHEPFIRRLPFFLLLAILPLLSASWALTFVASHNSQRPNTIFNYQDALKKSIMFYEEQMSGTRPAWDTITWRGDSALSDGSDVGHDLTGGWYTAGSTVKFGLPMAESATMLAWSVLANQSAYARADQLTPMLENLRFVNDYFIKAHTAPDELYGQVGDPTLDKTFWGPVEVMQMQRPAYNISPKCPGSDLAGETAAALASASLVFQRLDPSYAQTLLTHAKQLYSFADTYRGLYQSCMPVGASYPSSGYQDELVWGAIWLYKATHDSAYLSKAKTYYTHLDHAYNGTLSWDDVSYGCYVLLATITGEQTYKDDTQRWLNYWTIGYNGKRVPYSPGGEAVLNASGSLRYSADTAFLAFVYSSYLGSNNSLYAPYHNFAVQQINYILGANPRHCSYMVGFGSCYPQTPQDNTSHGSWTNNAYFPTYQRHILYGALVGGPSSPNDVFLDDRSNKQTNSIALDYNAGLTGALAYMYDAYGGSPTPLPFDKPADDDELYTTATIVATGSNFAEIKAQFINKSSTPARIVNQLSLRYYFTMNTEAGTITPTLISSQCGKNKISGPTAFSGTIYYITVSCKGIPIYPGGEESYQKTVQFRLTASGTWDPTNGWSYAALGTKPQPEKTQALPLFNGETEIWGTNPSMSDKPTLTFASPLSNATFPVNTPVPLTATMQNFSQSIKKVEFYVGTSLLKTLTAAPYTTIWQPSQAGIYTITAKAYDNLEESFSSSTQVIINASAPTLSVQIVTPASGSVFSAPAMLSLQALVNGSTHPIAGVEFYSQYQYIGAVTTSPYVLSWQQIPAGTYTLVAEVYDTTGKMARSQPITITVRQNPQQIAMNSCRVHYEVRNAWQNVFVAAITITNPGQAAIQNWRLDFSFPDDQHITDLWNARAVQHGQQVTITPLHDTTIGPGGRQTVGIEAVFQTRNTNPTTFLLNGSSCMTV